MPATSPSKRTVIGPLIGQIKKPKFTCVAVSPQGYRVKQAAKHLFTMSKDPAGHPSRGIPAKLVSLTKRRSRNGGARRDRTDDLMLAKHALSQLSYGPGRSTRDLVGPGRLELPTSRLSGVRSNHLSYGPLLVRDTGSRPACARWA